MEEEKKENAVQNRIDPTTGGIMIAVALLFDAMNAGINLIPLLGQVLSVLISLVAYLTFGFWFLKLGVGFVNPKRAASFFGSALIEAIPLLNILPGITVGVALTILVVQLEDKTGIKMPTKA